MRMWMIDVKYMCGYHIIKEHNDIHRLLWLLESKKFDLTRYNFPIIRLEPQSIEERHDALKREMERRHIVHIGEIGHVTLWPYLAYQINVKVDLWHNAKELCRTCSSCRKKILRKN
ncbi:MAG: hypothetical protein DRO88_02600 [Promethearchaeia archaeon]|nr:MAG: hypothetical protein DRO88_02600 [Candidatus Lokiarchaeia archaeon]